MTKAVPAGPQFEFFPRNPEEWQGMPVNMTLRAMCERRDGCGHALACIDGLCNPCTVDAQCASKEVCVLDHCVLAAQASCRSKRDCNKGELCVLSGLTGGTERGNEDMRAYCLASSGSTEQRPEDLDLRPGNPADPAPIETDSLTEDARRHLSNTPEPVQPAAQPTPEP